MRRENKIKVLAEVVEIGRFVTTAGVGGFIARLTPLRHPMEALLAKQARGRAYS
jgi:hypothetical protein